MAMTIKYLRHVQFKSFHSIFLLYMYFHQTFEFLEPYEKWTIERYREFHCFFELQEQEFETPNFCFEI